MLDEIDRQLKKDNNEGAFLVGLLNGSQTLATAAIGRVKQVTHGFVTDHVPVEFNTFCPKVLAGIGGLADTTIERSIQIKMERKPAKEKRPRWRTRDREEGGNLCRKIGTWVEKHADEIIVVRELVKPPEAINDRQWNSWEVLGAIADVAGGDWPKRASAACKYITDASDDTRSIGELLIGYLGALFNYGDDKKEFITSTVICELLNKKEERPWSKRNKGRGFDPNALSRMLRAFDVKPRQKKQPEGSVLRGYYYADLETQFTRYPATEGDNPLENIGNLGSGTEDII